MRLLVENLSKEYRSNVRALSEVHLALGPGVLGLLGPNGAGKSTLMRILATITQPSSGRVLWNDSEIARHPDPLRAVLGYLPQDFGVYPNLNAIEFLEYLAAVKGIQAGAARNRIRELLELVNLTEAFRYLIIDKQAQNGVEGIVLPCPSVYLSFRRPAKTGQGSPLRTTLQNVHENMDPVWTQASPKDSSVCHLQVPN
jgi:ABC-type Na+ transport system ATPase subunit NatA